jgi:hypothetical protein
LGLLEQVLMGTCLKRSLGRLKQPLAVHRGPRDGHGIHLRHMAIPTIQLVNGGENLSHSIGIAST